jgi:Xaa-Pro aminopeptidase
MTTDDAAQSRAVLMVGDTLSSPDIRHVVPVKVVDPIIYVEHEEHRTVYANYLDVPLLNELGDIEVVATEEIEDPESPGWDAMYWFETFSKLTIRVCRLQNVESAITPPWFPFAIAQALDEAGIALTSDEDFFVQRRRVKTADEVAGIRRASRAAEAGWDTIRQALRDKPDITSEELQMRVLREIAGHDVVPLDLIIVPHGSQSAIAHHGGSGSVRAGEPLIADLVMCDRETGMYADITRTFCVGEPPAELAEYFDLCHEALEKATAAVKPGAIPEELNDIVSEVFENAGYPTERQRRHGAVMDRGFYGGLGHGIGLEVHEPPYIQAGSRVPLLEGEVLCIEPALYRGGFGGCRLEDMVLVTSDGCERLSRYEYDLAP